MINSDHANFARVGIPAIRLVAGFRKQTGSNLRHVLTQADTRDKVSAVELCIQRLRGLTTAIVAAACMVPEEVGSRISASRPIYSQLVGFQ